MADGIQFEIEGVDALNARLAAVSEDVRLKGGRFALRKAAAIIVEAAKQNAERLDDTETGRKIAENIDMRWSGKHYKQTGDLKFRIGVTGSGRMRRGNPDTGPGGATPHWHFLELGTEKMPAQPFMRPAATDAAQEVTLEFMGQYKKALDRAIKRAAKRAAKKSGGS